MKALTPIILIIISVALFFLQINPMWQEIKILRAESEQYDEALETAKQLQEVRAELSSKLDSFPKEDLDRLEKFLPNNFDTIRLTLDVSSLAAKSNIKIEDIGTSQDGATGAEQFDQSQSKRYNKGSLSFSFTTSYNNALAFMESIERSLRLVDIVDISISSSDTGGNYSFDMTLQTYWVSPVKK